MADISKAGLKKEIAAILKDADLTTTSAKKVREELEDKLDCDLTSRKKEIDDLVMQCLKEKKKDDTKGSKKNGKKDSDEEEEEDEEEEGGGGGGGGGDEEDEEEEDAEEDASEEDEKPKRAAKKPAPKRKKGSSDESEDEDDKDSDDEYSPAKKAKGKAKGKGKGRKKKKGSDSDSDEDWAKNKKGKKAGGGGKRGGGGYTKVCTLTPELAAVVGQDTMARHEVVKKVWSIIKEKNLYDPKNKQFAICNDELLKVFGVKRFRTFGMMKYLKDHFVD